MLNEEHIIEELKQIFDSQLGGYLGAANQRYNDGITLVPFYGSARGRDTAQAAVPEICRNRRRIQRKGQGYRMRRLYGHRGPGAALPLSGWKYLARYREAVRELMDANRNGSAWEYCRVTGWKGSVITLRVEGQI